MTSLFRWPSGWDPLGTMRYMQRELDRLTGRGGFGDARRVDGGSFPPVNVLNGPDAMVVQCEVPGVAGDELDLSITGETLVIKGDKRPPITDEKVRYQRRERGFGQFKRTIVLPDKVDPDRVEASLDAGILTIRLPKSVSARPHHIQVK
jgi:HSP20 family protein